MWAIVYTLFLSFGLSIGSQIWDAFGPEQPGPSDDQPDTITVQGSFTGNDTTWNQALANGTFSFTNGSSTSSQTSVACYRDPQYNHWWYIESESLLSVSLTAESLIFGSERLVVVSSRASLRRIFRCLVQGRLPEPGSARNGSCRLCWLRCQFLPEDCEFIRFETDIGPGGPDDRSKSANRMSRQQSPHSPSGRLNPFRPSIRSTLETDAWSGC